MLDLIRPFRNWPRRSYANRNGAIKLDIVTLLLLLEMASILGQPPRRGHGEQRRASTAVSPLAIQQAKASFNQPPLDERLAAAAAAPPSPKRLVLPNRGPTAPSVAAAPAPRQTSATPVAFAKAQGWWRSAYLIDWATAAILFAVYLIFSGLLSPRQSITVIAGDPDKSLPYVKNSIPPWANTLLSILGPLTLVIVVQIFGPIVGWTSAFEMQEVHHAALGLFEAYSLSALVTKVIKLVAGAPRPNYFANPHPNSVGRESFPSAEACTAWMGWVFFVAFLSGKTKVWRSHSSVAVPFFVQLITFSALTVPTVVAVANYVNNQHRWEDIIGGAVIGSVTAVLVYQGLFKAEDGTPKSLPLQSHICSK